MKNKILILLCLSLGIILLISCAGSIDDKNEQTSDILSTDNLTSPPADTTTPDTTEKPDETISPPSDETSAPTEETTKAPESNTPAVSDDGGTRLPQTDVTTEKKEDTENKPFDASSYGEWVDGEFISTRTTWNIEFSFVEYTGDAIILKICDYDNLGFAFNDMYYLLEVLRDGEWVQISKADLKYAMKPGEVGYTLPSTMKDYADINSINFLKPAVDEELKSGHYRITKVLSGKYFSYEFALETE